jgi:hypothetical protein
MKAQRKWGVNPRSDKKGYVMPLWLQEVLQELRAQNKQEMVISSK